LAAEVVEPGAAGRAWLRRPRSMSVGSVLPPAESAELLDGRGEQMIE
jgi:hypothetical protein